MKSKKLNKIIVGSIACIVYVCVVLLFYYLNLHGHVIENPFITGYIGGVSSIWIAKTIEEIGHYNDAN